ncbi:hypothetical protein [Paenibacillus herberti]|uniref:Uncharacterized protein n=1 Tax=Paenibacillus herberti TaxID=1619309 RepID=A0A229NTY6_9BACL|nr:hypothetical protein [Paenibacillus herberti]OXM13373.1 hypothetical protein CGZ75_20130 [Paenibacillus herberti]
MEKSKLRILVLVVFVGLISVGYLAFTRITSDNTNDKSKIIEQNISELNNTNIIAKFSDITPFDWDKAFIIEDPFLYEEAIDKLVGAKCNLDRLETDIKRRIVFVNEGKFVFDYIYDIRDYMYNYQTIELTTSSSIFVENGTGGKLVLKIE